MHPFMLLISPGLLASYKMSLPVVFFSNRSEIQHLETNIHLFVGNVPMHHYTKSSHHFLLTHFKCTIWKLLKYAGGKVWAGGVLDFSSERGLKRNCFPRFPAHVHSGVARAWRINSCVSAGQKVHIYTSQKTEMSSR